MKGMRSLIPILIVQTCCALSQAQASSMIGGWEIEIVFANGENRSLRFEAKEGGRGAFQLVDPRSDMGQPATPSETKWNQSDDNSVTFSGVVEFPIGNVGRSQGTLVFKGRLEKGNSITGEVAFFPLEQDPKSPKATPSKKGTFKATRSVGKQNSNGFVTPESQPDSRTGVRTHVASSYAFISDVLRCEAAIPPVALSSFFSMSVNVRSNRVREI